MIFPRVVQAARILVRGNKNLPDDPAEMGEFEKWDLVREAREYGLADWKPRLSKLIAHQDLVATGGVYYQDTRVPFNTEDHAAVTLVGTMKQMWVTADWTPTYQNDWADGKLFMTRAFGRFTSAATPGNLSVQMGYGTADGTTGALATSAAMVWIASQANKSWRFEGRVRCRRKSVAGAASTGILFGTGIFEVPTTAIAVGGGHVPDATPAQVGSLNLAQTSGLHLQFARSGSTVETAQTHDTMLVAET